MSKPEDLQKDFNSKFNNLKCFLNENEPHFLQEPKILPCSNTACIECIKNNINNKILKCRLCKNEHHIENLYDLKSNDSIIDLINRNSDEINEELADKLNKCIEELKSEFKNRDEAVEALCSRAKKEIKERIEAIKNHLDVLHKEMLDSLALIKQNVTNEMEKLNKQAEEKCLEYESFSGKMQKMLDNFEENREELEKEIYKCQEYINDLNLLDENFHKILRKVSFEPSDWIPDETFICNYIGKFNIDEKNQINSDQEEDD